jgi:hypothetical protein
MSISDLESAWIREQQPALLTALVNEGGVVAWRVNQLGFCRKKLGCMAGMTEDFLSTVTVDPDSSITPRI